MVKGISGSNDCHNRSTIRFLYYLIEEGSFELLLEPDELELRATRIQSYVLSRFPSLSLGGREAMNFILNPLILVRESSDNIYNVLKAALVDSVADLFLVSVEYRNNDVTERFRPVFR